MKGAINMTDDFNNNSGFNPFDEGEKSDVFSGEQPAENNVNESQDAFSSPDSESENNAAEPAAPSEENAASAPFTSQNNQYTAPARQGNYTQYTPYGQPASQPENYGNRNAQYGYNGQPYQQPRQQFTPYGSTPPQKPKKKGGKIAVALIIVLVVVVAISAVIGSSLVKKSNNPSVSSTTGSSAQTTQQSGETTSSAVEYSTNSGSVQQLSAVDVAEKARKSVVGVMVYSSGKLSGEGSGVAMGLSKDQKYTYILTCAHVISDSGVTYRIQTLDEKNYEASLVAYDTRTDIGVLKVESNEIPLAELGDSSNLKVGETVYAIGNPGGSEYFGSMTDGIISAIDRSVSSTYTMTCIQHNAAINPGNSGGALVNSAGQVIGINSSKIAATDYEGMGFAVPIATAKSVAESLIQYGYVPNRPKLGIEYASVSSYQLYSMVVAIKGLPAGSLVIAGISNDSTLSGTKAQVGDLIVAVNGQKMDDSSVLLDLINTGAVGDTITLTLCRIESRTYKTTEFDVSITLVEDKGNTETTTEPVTDGGYYRGGSSSFEDFFKQYFGN